MISMEKLMTDKIPIDGFVNRRSGVQSPHPAPAFPPFSAEYAARDIRETRDGPRCDTAQKMAHFGAGLFQKNHDASCGCVALALAFFAQLNLDPDTMALARRAAAVCERGL